MDDELTNVKVPHVHLGHLDEVGKLRCDKMLNDGFPVARIREEVLELMKTRKAEKVKTDMQNWLDDMEASTEEDRDQPQIPEEKESEEDQQHGDIAEISWNDLTREEGLAYANWRLEEYIKKNDINGERFDIPAERNTDITYGDDGYKPVTPLLLAVTEFETQEKIVAVMKTIKRFLYCSEPTQITTLKVHSTYISFDIILIYN